MDSSPSGSSAGQVTPEPVRERARDVGRLAAARLRMLAPAQAGNWYYILQGYPQETSHIIVYYRIFNGITFLAIHTCVICTTTFQHGRHVFFRKPHGQYIIKVTINVVSSD